MISRMLLTLSGPSRKNATMPSHNSTRNQYIMQRATFFQRRRQFGAKMFRVFVARRHINLCGKFLELLHGCLQHLHDVV